MASASTIPMMFPVADTSSGHANNLMEVDPGMTTRYLQYECKYKMCKYRGADIKSWGQLIMDDYAHFAFLMTTEVGVESNTFLALFPYLCGTDRETAVTATRRRDTPTGKQTIEDEFLQLICSHKGRMHGLTWGMVRQKDYSYFVWAVGNTMGRETKSFSVFYSCLLAKEQKLVDSMPKGHVKVPKGLTFLPTTPF
jgi:hypothetical protein